MFTSPTPLEILLLSIACFSPVVLLAKILSGSLTPEAINPPRARRDGPTKDDGPRAD